MTPSGLQRKPLSVSPRRLIGLLAVAGLFFSGCAKSKPPGPELLPVSGAITLDGKPLAGATVGYAYEGPPPAGYLASGAVTDEQGRYRLLSGTSSGAAAGGYKVTVSRMAGKDGKPAPPPQEGMDQEQLRQQGLLVETIAPRYSDPQQTELKTTVEKGKAEGYDFALKGG